MNKRLWIKIAALSSLISVALGAFAAHGLESVLSDQRMEVFQTAVKYQMFHSLALLAVISLQDDLLQPRWKIISLRGLLLGIVLFCGSLYLLVMTNISALGMITPIGGTAFMIGWLSLCWAARKP
ncbi:MAG: DUF423 domain-containing protein [Porticoccaceae bacterium]